MLTDNYDDAMKYLSECRDMRVLLLHEMHRDVARSFYSMGLLYLKLGQTDNALEMFQRAHDIQICVLGEHHKHLRDTKHLMRGAYFT
jgi:tetratricopeptide (TPR) repeat protein